MVYEALERYDSLVFEQFQFSLIQNKIFTNASLAEKIYFKHFYKYNIYLQPSEMQNFCRRAYRGGMTDLFYRGHFFGVESCDINSSYPYQMIKAPLPTGPYFMKVYNVMYEGQPFFEHGIYEVIVKSSPTLKFPILCDVIDGKLTFA